MGCEFTYQNGIPRKNEEKGEKKNAKNCQGAISAKAMETPAQVALPPRTLPPVSVCFSPGPIFASDLDA